MEISFEKSLSGKYQFSHTAKLNLRYFVRLTGRLFLACASENHKQNLSCFPELIGDNL